MIAGDDVSRRGVRTRLAAPRERALAFKISLGVAWWVVHRTQRQTCGLGAQNEPGVVGFPDARKHARYVDGRPDLRGVCGGEIDLLGDVLGSHGALLQVVDVDGLTVNHRHERDGLSGHSVGHREGGDDGQAGHSEVNHQEMNRVPWDGRFPAGPQSGSACRRPLNAWQQGMGLKGMARANRRVTTRAPSASDRRSMTVKTLVSKTVRVGKPLRVETTYIHLPLANTAGELPTGIRFTLPARRTVNGVAEEPVGSFVSAAGSKTAVIALVVTAWTVFGASCNVLAPVAKAGAPPGVEPAAGGRVVNVSEPSNTSRTWSPLMTCLTEHFILCPRRKKPIGFFGEKSFDGCGAGVP